MAENLYMSGLIISYPMISNRVYEISELAYFATHPEELEEES